MEPIVFDEMVANIAFSHTCVDVQTNFSWRKVRHLRQFSHMRNGLDHRFVASDNLWIWKGSPQKRHTARASFTSWDWYVVVYLRICCGRT
jgi:hypothetical protein